MAWLDKIRCFFTEEAVYLWHLAHRTLKPSHIFSANETMKTTKVVFWVMVALSVYRFYTNGFSRTVLYFLIFSSFLLFLAHLHKTYDAGHWRHRYKELLIYRAKKQKYEEVEQQIKQQETSDASNP